MPTNEMLVFLVGSETKTEIAYNSPMATLVLLVDHFGDLSALELGVLSHVVTDQFKRNWNAPQR
jgi:hypothetical protein